LSDPPTLQQLLMARLDRLGRAREVAQIGSVIGRGFSYGLLHDVAGIEDGSRTSFSSKISPTVSLRRVNLVAGGKADLKTGAHVFIPRWEKQGGF
jgi:hypothetical protein